MSEELKKRLTKAGMRIQVKDAEAGVVEAVFSRFNVIDYDYDVTLPEAFEDGAKVLISAYGHRSWMGLKPVGRGVIRVEKDCAILDGQFWLDTIEGAETFKVVKNAAELQEWSYGFNVLETGELTEEMRQRGIRRVIKKVYVYEVSPVMVGAGIDTQTTSVKGQRRPGAEPEPEKKDDGTSKEMMAELMRFEKTRANLVR